MDINKIIERLEAEAARLHNLSKEYEFDMESSVAVDIRADAIDWVVDLLKEDESPTPW